MKLPELKELAKQMGLRGTSTMRKPELLATGPGQIWSWDITKLRGPGRGVWFQLYVVLDIFSRYVVAWTVQNG